MDVISLFFIGEKQPTSNIRRIICKPSQNLFIYFSFGIMSLNFT